MKNSITRQLILCIFIASVSNFSFAQNVSDVEKAALEQENLEAAYCKTQSSVCGTAPASFTLMLDFVREMMNSIKTIGPEGDYLGQYVNPNRFKGNVFSAPKKTVVGTVARNVAQKIKFGLASTAIFSSPVNVAGLKDMLGSVVLLSKNQVFLRDNKLVEQLDSQVNDKKYELGLGGGRYDQVIPQNLTIMQNIINSYIDKGLLLPSSKVNAGVSYTNITSLLTQVLSSAKSFLYFGSTDQLASMSRGNSREGIFIGFTTGAISTIQRTYNCARGPNYICSSESKKLKDKLSKLWKSLRLGSASTKKTFTDAVSRLGKIFSKTQSQSFKDREADLLKSMYGTTTVTKSTGLKGLLIDPFKKTLDSIKKSGAEVGTQTTDLGSDIATFWTSPQNLKDTVKSLPLSIIAAGDDSSPGTTNITSFIDTYVRDVFDSQQTDYNLVSMSEMKGVTPAFAVLGQQLSVIKNDILGGKDNKSSLLGSLGAACELQCGGGGSCR